MARIAVIGAGAAGLAAAYRLTSGGRHMVTVLERQQRVGGRALTLDIGLPKGLIAQAGPTRFLSDFRRVLRLARKFGHTTCPFYPVTGTMVAHLGGSRIAHYQPPRGAFWGYPEDVDCGHAFIVAAGIRLARNFRRAVRRTLAGGTNSTFMLREGTQSLIESLSVHAKIERRLGCRVRSIEAASGGVSVGFETDGRSESSHFDFAICAVPLSELLKIAISPALPPVLAELAATVPFSSALRIYLQLRRPYWSDKGFNGFGMSDTLGEIWGSGPAAGGAAMLVTYAKAEQADRLDALSERDLVTLALDEIDNIFPGVREHFLSAKVFSWKRQVWVGGEWPLARDGFEEKICAFRAPVGRICFAGDYVTIPEYLNTVEGALESGEHAVRLIEQIALGRQNSLLAIPSG
jgi:monoamine oxidase